MAGRWFSRRRSSRPQQVWDPVLRYAKRVTMVKLGVAAIGGLGTLIAADPIYVLWKASSCDLPEPKVLAYEILRDNVVKQLTRVMDMNAKSFVVLSGTPGVGKTTAVLNAARQRGTGVLYINGATAGTVDGVIQKIVRKYGSLWDILRRTNEPGWTTLTRAADWYFWLYQRELVVIIDHIDRVEGAVKQLLYYAKEAADGGKLRVFFIASEEIPNLRETSAYRTRAMEVRLGPASIKSVKELLEKVAPDRKAQWDEIIYLSGCNLSDVWYYIDGLQVGYSLSLLQREKDYNISFLSWGDDKSQNGEELAFWKRLLEAGACGVGMPASPAKLAALQSNNCCRIHKDRVYFRDGVCIDFYARLLNFKIGERKYEAFACDATSGSDTYSGR